MHGGFLAAAARKNSNGPTVYALLQDPRYAGNPLLPNHQLQAINTAPGSMMMRVFGMRFGMP